MNVTPLLVINIIALLLSPVVAVVVTLLHQHWSQTRNSRLTLLHTLVGTRHLPIGPEAVRALNMIDIVFYDKPSIRALWHNYIDMLGNEGLNNPMGWAQRQKKNLELIAEMAKTLGYGDSITHLDLDRVYYPIALGESDQRSNELAVELLRVLKNTQGLQAIPLAMASSPSGTPPRTAVPR